MEDDPPNPSAPPAAADADLDGKARRRAARASEARRDRSVVSGALLLLGSGFTSVAVEAGSTLLLARLLTPSDFGLLAMATVLFALVNKVRGFGLGAATIQRKDLDEAALARLFWLNLKLNLGVTACVGLAAPLAAWFFGEPKLTWIVWVLALSSLALSSSAIHDGLLRRDHRFTTVTAIAGAATAVSTATAIVTALLGFGYVALLLQLFLRQAVEAVGLFALTRWRPHRGPRTAAGDAIAREMLGYGGSLSASNVVAWLGRNLDFVLVGWIGGTAALGLYHKAYRLAAMPFQQLYLPTMNVALTKFSRLQERPDDYRASLRRSMLLLLGVIVPLMMYLAVEAEPAILLLGPQWIEAIPLFRLLLLGTFCNGLLLILKWCYQCEGRTASLLRFTLWSSPVMAAGVAAGAPWGPVGIAIGFDVSTALLVWPAYRAFCRGSVVRAGDFFGPMLPALAAAGLAAAAVWAVTQATLPAVREAWPPARLAVGLLVMGLVYPVAWMLLPGGRARVADVALVLRPLLQKRGLA